MFFCTSQDPDKDSEVSRRLGAPGYPRGSLLFLSQWTVRRHTNVENAHNILSIPIIIKLSPILKQMAMLTHKTA